MSATLMYIRLTCLNVIKRKGLRSGAGGGREVLGV